MLDKSFKYNMSTPVVIMLQLHCDLNIHLDNGNREYPVDRGNEAHTISCRKEAQDVVTRITEVSGVQDAKNSS